MSYISAQLYKNEVIVWESDNGALKSKRFRAPFTLYVEDNSGEFISINGITCKKESYNSKTELSNAASTYSSQGLQTFEADVNPVFKILSENYYKKPAPKLNVCFYDIEVDSDPTIGFASVENPYSEINAIALYHQWKNTMAIAVVPPPNLIESNSVPSKDKLMEEMDLIATMPTDCITELTLIDTEKELLQWFLSEIKDVHALSGWNSSAFDIPYIGKRILKVFGKRGKDYLKPLNEISYQSKNPADYPKEYMQLCFDYALPPKRKMITSMFGTDAEILILSGRIEIDYMELFKRYSAKERTSWKLESVADEFLPHLPKLSYKGSLYDLYRNDFSKFVRYNFRDTEILKGLEEKLGYFALANELVHLSCGLFDDITGTLVLADLAIMNYCHYDLPQFTVVNNTERHPKETFEGAYVLNPKSGIHKRIGSIDINSLYPSIMMALNISPETIVGQFQAIDKCSQVINKDTDDDEEFKEDDDEESYIDMSAICYEIKNKTDTILTLETSGGTPISKKAKDWNTWLYNNKFSVSGYGTIYDQSYEGIIPNLLSQWFKSRKDFQKKKKEALKQADDILNKYK